MKTQNTSIDQAVVNKVQEREQALNGWIVASSAQGEVVGYFSGIKAMAGETLVVSLTFTDGNKTCNTNGLAVSLVEGDYLPTKGLIKATVVSGIAILIKGQIF